MLFYKHGFQSSIKYDKINFYYHALFNLKEGLETHAPDKCLDGRGNLDLKTKGLSIRELRPCAIVFFNRLALQVQLLTLLLNV